MLTGLKPPQRLKADGPITCQNFGIQENVHLSTAADVDLEVLGVEELGGILVN